MSAFDAVGLGFSALGLALAAFQVIRLRGSAPPDGSRLRNTGSGPYR